MGRQGVDGMEGVEENEGMVWKEETRLNILSQLLRVGEVVNFTSIFGNKSQMMIVGKVSGPNLRSLTLPGNYVTLSFFLLLLANRPNLGALAVEGDLDDNDGITSVHICHLKLTSLKLIGFHPFHLHIECPSLLDLSFGENTLDPSEYRSDLRAPSLKCPRLINLHLSNPHSPTGVLEAILAHAPNIHRLKSCVNKESHFSTLLSFKGLQALSLYVHETYLPPNAFEQWPNLERLELDGVGVAVNLVIAHKRLTSFTIKEHDKGRFVILDCPLLEELRIEARFHTSWDETTTLLCPQLKKIHLVWDMAPWDIDFELDEGLCELDDNIVEELVLQFLARDFQITCENLKKLVIIWAPFRDPRFPTIEC